MKKTLRRLAAGTAASLLGAAGAVVLSAPASAHAVLVDGEAVCDTSTGEWVITWSLANDMPHEAELTEVTLEPATELPLTTVVTGAQVPAAGDGPLTEELRLVGDIGFSEMTLTVTAHWPESDTTETGTATVSLAGSCEPFWIYTHERVTWNCDIFLYLIRNDEDGEVTVELAVDSDTRHGTAPGLGELVNDDSDHIEIPADAELSDVSEISAGSTVELTIDPGTAYAHGFEPKEGLTIAAAVSNSEGSMPAGEWTWTEPYGVDCAAGDDGESAGGEAAGGDELPLTGSSTALIAGGSLALLAVGAGLFFLARRRRINFTA